jgi:hypothetical protein
MTDIVLVPGGWRGGWTFSSIARDLRARGHETWTPTLTGLGERVHLAARAPSVRARTAACTNDRDRPSRHPAYGVIAEVKGREG